MPESRLYKVVAKDGNTPKNRLFKSSTKGKVESHLVSERYEIEVANSTEVADLMTAGVKVEAVE